MKEEPKTKEIYGKLSKKHSLPDFNSLNTEFEIGEVEEKDFLLRAVRRKIEDKIDSFLKILDTILQPDTAIVDLRECKEFNDKEKEAMFELYMKLMLFKRQSTTLSVRCDDASDADFINRFYKEYRSIKKKMLEITKKIENSWKKTVSVKEEIGYLG